MNKNTRIRKTVKKVTLEYKCNLPECYKIPLKRKKKIKNCETQLKPIAFTFRYEQKMKQTEERMRALGLLTPSCVLTLDEWEIPRDRVVINRKLGEGAFGTVYGGEAFFDEKGWVS